MICPPLKKSRAFSLAELLVSSLITSALLFGLAGTIYLLIEIRRYTDDLDAALSRAEMVFSILRTPIEYSGYGLPKDETDYMECFGMPAVSPYNWPGPLSVSFSNRVGMGRRENAVCKITYAIETKCRTLTQEAVSGDRFKIAASGTPAQLLTDAKDADPETIIQNWFVFGAMTPRRVPARYTGRSTAAKITYLSFKFKKAVSEPVLIPENDEIYGLRALECEVRKKDDDFALYSNDQTGSVGSGWQPRVDGVIDIRFSLDGENRIITVETLTRGVHRYKNAISSDALEEWRKKYGGVIPEEALHYRLASNTAVFEIKNF